MSSNPDEIYSAKVAVEPVAPAMFWVYPSLKRVKGSMQRSLLNIAKRKASMPWLYRLLTLGWVAVLSLRIWAHETGRAELLGSTKYALLVVLAAALMLLVFRVLRTRHFLRLQVVSEGEAGVDA